MCRGGGRAASSLLVAEREARRRPAGPEAEDPRVGGGSPVTRIVSALAGRAFGGGSSLLELSTGRGAARSTADTRRFTGAS